MMEILKSLAPPPKGFKQGFQSGHKMLTLALCLLLALNCQPRNKNQTCGSRTASFLGTPLELFSQKSGVVGGFLEFDELELPRDFASIKFENLSAKTKSYCTSQFRFFEDNQVVKVLIGTSAGCYRKLRKQGLKPKIRVFISDTKLGTGWESFELIDPELAKRDLIFSQLSGFSSTQRLSIFVPLLEESSTSVFYNYYSNTLDAQRACIKPLTPEQSLSNALPEIIIPEPTTCPWFFETMHRTLSVQSTAAQTDVLKYLIEQEVKRSKNQVAFLDNSESTTFLTWEKVTEDLWNKGFLKQELKTLRVLLNFCQTQANSPICFDARSKLIKIVGQSVKSRIQQFDSKLASDVDISQFALNSNLLADLEIKAQKALTVSATLFGETQKAINVLLLNNQIKLQIGGVFSFPDDATGKEIGYALTPATSKAPALNVGMDFRFEGARMNFKINPSLTKNLTLPSSQGTALFYNLQPILYFTPITQESGGASVMELPARRQRKDESNSKTKESAGGEKPKDDGC